MAGTSPIGWLCVMLCLVLCAAKPDNKDCQTVKQGHFYSDHFIGPPVTSPQEKTIMCDANMAKYLFPNDVEKGGMCQVSWNKLFGLTRCLHLVHDDSDRFVWRRHPDCVKISGGRVIGEVDNCPYAGQLQVAAYCYDQGRRPYQNDSLLTVFNTLINVSLPYQYKIDVQHGYTEYTLYSGDAKTQLEQHRINHGDCGLEKTGLPLYLYFGGECAAPQTVSYCDIKQQTGKR